jgi:transposase
MQKSYIFAEKKIMPKERLKVNESAEVIATYLRKDEKFSRGVRLYAVHQIALGKKAGELQSVYNTTHRSICSWVKRFNAEGVEGLKDRPRSGRPSRLSGAAKAELKQAVLKSPVEHGFSSGTWTWALVAEYIRTTPDFDTWVSQGVF